MARKKPGAEFFPFKITLLSRETAQTEKPRWVGANQWRHLAIYSIRMKFWYQARKAKLRSQYKWYKYYTVTRYGAPGRLEFICPESGMVAKTIHQDDALLHRIYWTECAKKSQEIVQWLDSIDHNRYTSAVHSYLLSLLIVKPPILREVAAYEAVRPFKKPKPWQTTRVKGIESFLTGTAGRYLQKPKPITG